MRSSRSCDSAEKLLEIALGVADVGMQRDVIDLVFERVEDRPVPANPVRIGPEVGGAAGDQLDAGILPPHGHGRDQRELSVVLRVLVAELPGPVDLVAEAPDLDVPRLLPAVLGTLLGPIRGPLSLQYSTHWRAWSTDAQTRVDADIRLRADALAVAQELVGAEAVGFKRAPGVIGTGGTLVARADSIGPVVAGGEVPARPPKDGNAEGLHRLDHVLPIAVGVGKRATLLEDAAINTAAQVLGEVAEDVWVHLADHAVGIDANVRGRRLRSHPRAGQETEQRGIEGSSRRHSQPPIAAPSLPLVRRARRFIVYGLDAGGQSAIGYRRGFGSRGAFM